MTKSTVALRLGLFVSAAATACVWAPSALADDGTAQTTLGGQADIGGGQTWTVDELEPSHDAIPYQPVGTLWEAEAELKAAQGGLPVIPGFSARAGDTSYPVLWPVPTAQGVNPSALSPGGDTEGKVYFDVTGPPPTAVTYTRDGRDVATWVEAPPSAEASTGVGSATPRTAPLYGANSPALTAPAAAAAVPAAVPVAPVPAAGTGSPAPAATPAPTSAGTPVAPGSTPVPPATSAGTPVAPNSAGTPSATATPASPAPTSPGTPTSAGTPATGSAAPPAAATPSPTATATVVVPTAAPNS